MPADLDWHVNDIALHVREAIEDIEVALGRRKDRNNEQTLAGNLNKLLKDNRNFVKLRKVIEHYRRARTILDEGTSPLNAQTWFTSGSADGGVVRLLKPSIFSPSH